MLEPTPLGRLAPAGGFPRGGGALTPRGRGSAQALGRRDDGRNPEGVRSAPADEGERLRRNDNCQLFGRGAHQGSDPGGSPASDTRVVGDASPVRSVRLGSSGGGSAARRPCGGGPTHQRASGRSDLGGWPASGSARSRTSPKWRLAVKGSRGRRACRDSGRQRCRLSCDLESSAPCQRRHPWEDRRRVPARRAVSPIICTPEELMEPVS